MTKPADPEEEFFKELDAARDLVRSGAEPEGELAREMFYVERLMPKDVPYDTFRQVVESKVPDRISPLKEGTTFSFSVPQVRIVQKKGTEGRFDKLRAETLRATDLDDITRSLNANGLTVRGEADAGQLRGAAVTLQKMLDTGKPVGELLHRVQLAAALHGDEQLKSRIQSSDMANAASALHELYTDRHKDEVARTVAHKDRLENLRSHYSGILGVPVKYLPSSAEEASEAKRIGLSNFLMKKNIGEVPKHDGRKAKEFLMAFNPEYELYHKHASKSRKAAKNLVGGISSEATGGKVKVHVDFSPSFPDLFAGYFSGDCTKGAEREYLKGGLKMGRLYEGGAIKDGRVVDGKHVGYVYVSDGTHGKKTVAHIDAFQPLSTTADQKALIEKFLEHFDRNLDPRYHEITANASLGSFSNHPTTQEAYRQINKAEGKIKVSIHAKRAQSRNADHVLLRERHHR